MSYLEEYNIDSFDNLLNKLNNYSKIYNNLFTIIMDGINEWQYFNRDNFFEELKCLYEKLINYSNIRLLISIMSEYININCNNDEYSLIKLEQPDILLIYRIFKSLGINNYYDITNFNYNTPIGFFIQYRMF